MTVIRDAVIRIRTERTGGTGGGFEARALAQETRAAKELGTELKGVESATDRLAVRYGRTEIQGVRAFRNLGRGALELARGTAYLAASSQDELNSMLRHIVAIEAGVSIFKGVADAGKGLNAVIGSGATAMVGWAGAVTSGFVALDYFSESSRRARREVEEFNQAREASFRNGQREQRRLSGAAGTAAAIRGIDLELANLGLPADRLRGLRDFEGRLEQDQSNAALREGFARNRLGEIDAGRAPKKFRGEAEASLLDAEIQQQQIIRDRIRVEQDILHAKQEELQRQAERLRGNDSLDAFSRLPGVGGFFERGRDATLAGIDQQKDQLVREFNGVVGGLLQALREQTEQVEAVRSNMRSLER